MISLSICLYSSCEYLLILISFIRSVILKMSDSDMLFLNISQSIPFSFQNMPVHLPLAQGDRQDQVKDMSALFSYHLEMSYSAMFSSGEYSVRLITYRSPVQVVAGHWWVP